MVSWFHRDNKVLLPIQLYIVVSLALNVLLKITDFLPKNIATNNYTNLVINIYSISEISLIYYFIFSLLKGSNFKTLMIFLYIFYLSVIVIIWFTSHNSIFFYLPLLMGLENLFIVISSFFYMYEIFKSNDILNFKADPKFIAVSGILFYFSISIPFFFWCL